MTIKITFKGDKELNKALKKMGKEANKELMKAVNATGLELRGDIIKRYAQGPATGIVYEKYLPRRTHQASAAGEAPKTDQGGLAGSVTFKTGVKRPTVRVFSKLVYAYYLEFGTRTGIAPRPAWTPAVEKMRKVFLRRVEKAIRKSMP